MSAYQLSILDGSERGSFNTASNALLVDTSGKDVTPTGGSLTLNGSSQQLSGTSKPCFKITLFTPAHTVTLGTVTGTQPITLAASTVYNLDASNVNQYWVTGTNADVLGYIYYN